MAPVAARQFSGSKAVQSAQKMEVHQGYKTLKDLQAKYQVLLICFSFKRICKNIFFCLIFQQHDGKPVHLKRGASDTILYGITMVGCLGGLGGILKLLYDLS